MQSLEPAMAAGGRRKRTDGSQGSGKNGQRGRCDLHWGVFAELVVGTAINAAISTGTCIESNARMLRRRRASEHEIPPRTLRDQLTYRDQLSFRVLICFLSNAIGAFFPPPPTIYLLSQP